jgi:hypothetical protein
LNPDDTTQDVWAIRDFRSVLSNTQQERHLLPQMFDFLMRFPEVCQQTEIVPAHGAATKQPGPDAEQLVQLHQLAIRDEDFIFPNQGLHQALKLPQNIGREE